MQLSAISLALTRLGWLSTFTPASLFTTGVNGAWYDPSDYGTTGTGGVGTLFQNAAGTTPVTAVEQPVGLMLDKSKGLVLGSELVTNGDFSNGTTGWTAQSASLSVVSGQLVVVPSTTFGYAYQAITTVVGTTYKITFSYDQGTAAIARYFVGTSVGDGSVVALTTVSGTGTISRYFTATSTTTYLHFGAQNSSGQQALFDNISLKSLPGNHAFNGSGNSANFPVLSARYNLLTKTEDFSDAAWSKSNATVTANALIAPDGTNTADALIENSANGFHQTSATSAITSAAGTHVLSVYAKANQRNYVYLNITSGGIDNTALFDLTTGNYSGYFTGGVVATSYSSQNVGNGWWKVSITVTTTAATLTPSIGIRSTAGNFSSGYTGDGTSGIYIWGADLRVANDALNQPAYQRVNTASDYDTVGFKPYLRFNGTNQWLQTSSIDFSYGDKMFVSAGVRKLSDANGYSVFAETNNALSANNWTIHAPFAPNTASFDFSSRGSSGASATATSGYAAPITKVLSGIGNISGDQAILRINGTQAAISTADQGTGNFGSYPLYLGARAGTSLWFNGRLYGMVVAGKQASAAEITSTETYINQKTGAF